MFTLRPVSGATQQIAPKVVLVRRPGLPRYLDRNAIVTAMPGYQVQASSGDRWAEPIGSMFARVLAQDLAQRLPGATVLGEQGAVTLPPDVSVNLEIQDFGPDATGTVLLQGQLAIDRTAKVNRSTADAIAPVRSIRLSVRPASSSTADLAAAMSDVTGQLADMIAAALR